MAKGRARGLQKGGGGGQKGGGGGGGAAAQQKAMRSARSVGGGPWAPGTPHEPWPMNHQTNSASRPCSGCFLTTGRGGGAGGDSRDPPTTDLWQTHRPTNVLPPRGGGVLLDTPPPPHPPNYHRQNALTQNPRGGGLQTHPPTNSDNPPPHPPWGRTHTKKHPGLVVWRAHGTQGRAEEEGHWGGRNVW